MELFVRNVPFSMDDMDVHTALAPILHGPLFSDLTEGPFNFLVRLFKDKKSRNRNHAGYGIVVVPSVVIGEHFLHLARSEAGTIYLYDRELRVSKSKGEAKERDLELLQQPYIDPQILEDQHKAERAAVKLGKLQFGWLFPDGKISIEWDAPESHVWSLGLDPDTRSFTIKSQSGIEILISLNNVQSIAFELQACVLRLERPPIFQREKGHHQERPAVQETAKAAVQTAKAAPEDFQDRAGPIDILSMLMATFDMEAFCASAAELFADVSQPSGPTRQRLMTLDDDRGNVFAFFRVVRVTFDDDSALRKFQMKARDIQLTTYSESHEAPNQRVFDRQSYDKFSFWLKDLPFDIAFQLEGLISRCRFNPKELLELRISIRAANKKYGNSLVCDCVKLLEPYREEANDGVAARDLFDRIVTEVTSNPHKPQIQIEGRFYCHRVAVTPTSFLLSGPLPDETNRVLRKYIKYQYSFIRVEFRDENRLRARPDRDIDFAKFLDDRFGKILEDGLVIAGRKFEFLAYSSSALKEHAVWFVTPFKMDDGVEINAKSIRDSLGDFSKVIHCPSLYGARIAQAFSSTEPSITMKAGEMYEIEDKRSSSGSELTDGVGTVSPEVADRIWDALTTGRPRRARRQLRRPSAFQVRLGGIKGVVCVDERLKGKQLCWRSSMKKFESDDLMVEICRAFDKPMNTYLNRPLIMLLETLGITKEPLMELQKAVVDKTEAALKSIGLAAETLEQHGLGKSFHMSSILLSLHNLNAGWESTDRNGGFPSFLKRIMRFAVNHVLRDLKYKARIPVPNSWTLVGVADEYDYLEEGQIYACICHEGGNPEYIEGPVLISRSPTVHPGDARMVWAIGKPPPDAPTGLGQLINCIAFSCKGERSLPSMLAGGDLDGDIYCLILDKRLHQLAMPHEPGSYEKPKRVELDRPSTARDIGQFVIDFIKSDILGVIATQILLTADTSPKCMADDDCLKLAALHSDAVDFPKTGRPVDNAQLPILKSKKIPDWHARETGEKDGDYESDRIIGHLFREIHLPAIQEAKRVGKRQRRQLNKAAENIEARAILNLYPRGDDEITRLMKKRIERYLNVEPCVDDGLLGEIEEMMAILSSYADELSHICKYHSLSHSNPLTEEEIVAGTIVAKCSQPRMRSDSIRAMRRVSEDLATHMREQIEGADGTSQRNIILRAWTAWKVSMSSGDAFGARSFGLLALDILFSALHELDAAQPHPLEI